MKKLFVILLAVILFSGCSAQQTSDENLKVTATLFPQYDFAKAIGGDKIDIKLLLKPGVDSHSYEPTGSDMMEISDSDIFIYTGDAMEGWAETILDSVDKSNLNVVNVSDGINIATISDVQEHSHDEYEAEHSHSIYDPHIWTDPLNAKIIVENILTSFIASDPENEAYYTQNAEKLLKELDALDKDFQAFFDTCTNKKIIFGGKFAMYYFAKRYGIECIAAYDSCSTQSEPSPGKIAEIIDIINKEGLKAVYHEELVNPTVAQTIASETNVPALLLHSCHNVSNEDFNNGETYISLMRKNLDNLKKGMN